MRIMVFDVPAESGGALSVLNYFYNKYTIDLNNEYIFVVSKPMLIETENTKILRYPWIKNSWLHRLFFDYVVAHKLIKKYKIDQVLSLQNIIIPRTHVPQCVYVHNALPLSDYRFKLFENQLLWVYQNILSRGIFNSIRNADRVIVQTVWMKKKSLEKLKVDANKIEVLLPEVDIKVKKRYRESREKNPTFFYPASGVIFKNHEVIIEACIKLKEQGIQNYRVLFTLENDENKHVLNLYKKVSEHKLPIFFIGSLSRSAVFDYYSKSTLIFPSYIETVGLPLLEARKHGTPILASNCDFSHEVLYGYENVIFFNPFDHEEIANLMKNKIINDGFSGM